MSKGILLLFLLFIAGFFHSAPLSAQDFVINSFHADISIHEDSELTVRETIEVEFQRPRHGIYREIPFQYEDERGGKITTPISVLSVADPSGKDWKYRVTRKGNVLNIRIGDSQSYVERRQTYVISYTVRNAVLFFEDHDELYWNVTGNYWWSPIDLASARVTLAAKNKSQHLWAACYTGAHGSKEAACEYEASHNSGEFSATRGLSSKEGLTIAFGWDKGLVVPPSAWNKFLWALNIRENWVFVLPLFSLIFMGGVWRSRGRDPRVKESVTVMYEPPQYKNVPLTPGEVGALVDEKLDPRDITSTLVGLAVKGFLTIEETKIEGLIVDSTDYYLKRLKEPDESLSPFEKVLMASLFTSELPVPGRMISELKNSFYKELDLLKSTLYGELVNKKYFLVSPDKVRKVYLTAGGVLILFSILVLTWLMQSPKSVVAGILMGLPILAFARVMPAKTKAGASAYMDILGFQEFMSRAEKDKLQRMGDRELFSKFLPYAIALDVVDNWAKAFEGIYQEPPQWYASQTSMRAFNPYVFSRSISSATSSLASAMYAAPRGSGISGGGGFGGGGFSGGGFGGGGGGSW
ncbi:MAG: DUF2207 domain-containing protein [Thermodesulfovibrionales bacterium]|nr:DUF2207 domain-containing protein [Thermodesulfovibrionales bacterium]